MTSAGNLIISAIVRKNPLTLLFLGSLSLLYGSANVYGTANIDGTSDVNGTIDDDRTIDVNGTADVDGTANIDRTVDVNRIIDVDGTIGVGRTINIDGTIEIDGTADVHGTVDVDGTVATNGSAVTLVGFAQPTVSQYFASATRVNPSLRPYPSLPQSPALLTKIGQDRQNRKRPDIRFHSPTPSKFNHS
jgi:cytoskeletal protein CcmA (bactofilin family)